MLLSRLEAPPLDSGPAVQDPLRDVLDPEGLEGLGGVLDDDRPHVGAVLAVVLDHLRHGGQGHTMIVAVIVYLGQGLLGLHLDVLVGPGDQHLALGLGAQLVDELDRGFWSYSILGILDQFDW